MPDVPGEIEMRIEGAADLRRRELVGAEIRKLDPSAVVRYDEETGILHLRTGLDTLEVVAGLGRAGITATAMTG